MTSFWRLPALLPAAQISSASWLLLPAKTSIMSCPSGDELILVPILDTVGSEGARRKLLEGCRCDGKYDE
uniref:Putative secreted protein n=1 Tax=Anopheles triannulatus TaxID=58253 RepID=A0A2M4B4K0_9DIPT